MRRKRRIRSFRSFSCHPSFLFQLLLLLQETSRRCLHHVVQQELPGNHSQSQTNQCHLKFQLHLLQVPLSSLRFPSVLRSGSTPPSTLPREEGHAADCNRAVVVGFFVVVAVCLQPLCHSHPICNVIHLD